ncbi:hypothetical protein Vretimale_19343, partial [Volvox reticuliferus]
MTTDLPLQESKHDVYGRPSAPPALTGRRHPAHFRRGPTRDNPLAVPTPANSMSKVKRTLGPPRSQAAEKIPYGSTAHHRACARPQDLPGLPGSKAGEAMGEKSTWKRNTPSLGWSGKGASRLAVTTLS